jgi:hypothetical protein
MFSDAQGGRYFFVSRMARGSMGPEEGLLVLAGVFDVGLEVAGARLNTCWSFSRCLWFVKLREKWL